METRHTFLTILAMMYMAATFAQNNPPVAVNDVADLFVNTETTWQMLANDTDPDGNALSFNVTPIVNPSHGFIVSIDATGSVRYQPHINYVGADSFQYEICDNGMPSLCDKAWMIFHIDSIPNCPVTGNGKADLQFRIDAMTSSKVYIALDIRAHAMSNMFMMGGTHLRFSFSRAIANPTLHQSANFEGMVTIAPPTIVHFADHHLSGSVDTIVQYNTQLTNFSTTSVTVDTQWVTIGVVAFDIVDSTQALNLTWHDPNIQPSTVIAEARDSVCTGSNYNIPFKLLDVEAGTYQNLSLSLTQASPVNIVNLNFPIGTVNSSNMPSIGLSNRTTQTISRPQPISNISIQHQRNQIDTHLHSPKAQLATWELFAINGRQIHSQEIRLTQGVNKVETSIPTIAQGVYLVKISTNKGVYTRKLYR